MNRLGELLKRKREQMGLSLRNVAELTGLSHAYIKILEKGEDPKTKAATAPTIITLVKLADFLNIKLPDLLILSGYIKSDDEINPNYDDENFKEFYNLAKTMSYKELQAATEISKRGLSLVEINTALKASRKENI
jgi:transcriptional regulator with XRE-family HTH domain